MFNKLTSPQARSYIEKIQKPLSGLPDLPRSLMKSLESLLPWIVIIVGIGSILAGFSTLVYGSSMATSARLSANSNVIHPLYVFLTGLITIGNGVLCIKAFPLLQDHKEEGWIYLFWVTVLSALHSIIRIVFFPLAVLSALITIFISFYLVFQFRPFYKKT